MSIYITSFIKTGRKIAAVATFGDTSVMMEVIIEVEIIKKKGGSEFKIINLSPTH